MSNASLNRGLFITFEGIDGSGKSTQMELAAKTLKQQGYEVIVTRNPGGTELGLGIRQILLHHPGYVSSMCELLLYIADRAQHMDEVVFPALDAGKIVICDRHMDSTLAYQGYGRDLDKAQIDQLNKIAIQSRKPDLTMIIDGPTDKLLERVNRRGEADRLEREKVEFFERVASGYRAIAQQEPERVKMYDAMETIEALHQQIMQTITQHLAKAQVPS